MYHVRDATENDSNYIFDIDLKCFETAWTPDEWREKAEHYRIQVCSYFGTPIGFIVFREFEGGVEIAKIAVKVKHRLKGVAGQLLDTVMEWARSHGIHRLSLMVPEYMIDPDHPQRICGWLVASRFCGTKPFIRGAFTICGESEAGVIFERSI
jgi:GNAT superfamily N-acetyltransferase